MHFQKRLVTFVRMFEVNYQVSFFKFLLTRQKQTRDRRGRLVSGRKCVFYLSELVLLLVLSKDMYFYFSEEGVHFCHLPI